MSERPGVGIESGATKRSSARALVPVLLSLVLLALMIVTGIARNRARVRFVTSRYAGGHQERFAAARHALGALCDAAARFVASRQRADGSWGRDAVAPPSSAPAGGDATLAGTVRILLNVTGTGYETEPFYAAGVRFLRGRPLGPGAGSRDEGPPRPGGVAPDSEGEARARFLEGSEPDLSRRLRALLEEPGTPADLYHRMLAGPSAPRPARPLEASRLRHDNLLIIGALPESAGAPSRSWLARVYLALLAAESGNPRARPLLGRLLEEVRPGAGAGPWTGLDTPSLAAWVAVRSEMCLLDGEPCRDVNAALEALVGRRQADGSWRAAPPAENGGAARPRLTWSPAEATSLVLRALVIYRRILDARADGAPPPDRAGPAREGRPVPRGR